MSVRFTGGPLPERVARLEVRVEDVEQEQLRARRRLHELETDRATIRLLAAQVKDLADSAERLATNAAERALSIGLDRVRKAHRDEWRYRLTWVSAGGALVGAIATLVFVFH
jgi:hypothetical protein